MVFDNFGFELLGKSSVLSALDDLLSAWTVDSEWYVVAGADYAPYVEYGTYKMQAQPYMRPAAKTVGSQMDGYMDRVQTADEAQRAVAKAVEEEAKRIVPVDTGHLKNSIETKQR